MLERDLGLIFPDQQPVKFSWQKAERFQSFVEAGLAESLEKSNFCWLACYDMVASTYLSDDAKRKEMLMEIADASNILGHLSNNGGLSLPEYEMEDEHVQMVSNIFSKYGIPLEMTTEILSSPKSDIIANLEEGSMLILGITAEGGHAILMDKVYRDQQGTEAIMSFWDPAVPFPEIAHGFLPSAQRQLLLYNGKQHFPVTVGINAHVVRKIPLTNGS